jgi:signal transduction histidine kinase
MNPLLAQLTHRPFPEVARAIRASAEQITRAWDTAVRNAMPQMGNLTFDELKDSTPEILLCIADALASDNPEVIEELMGKAPSQGLSRFRLNFDVVEVMQEDRLLRSITVQHAEAWLGRRMDEPESAALHAAIDVMLQRSVIALVDQQKAQLRAAAETELKFLSFLAHDLNNNLNSVILTLGALGMELQQSGGFPAALQSLESAQQSIFDTVAGMRRMVDHERTRKGAKSSPLIPVDLHATATKIIAQFQRQADSKGVILRIDVRLGSAVDSDAELLSIVLQNLVGNAVKYSNDGTVSIGFDPEASVIWVSDQGPGIKAENQPTIFDAFTRGESHGQQGLGLGLAIASQAAKLLGASLTVESNQSVGATFRVLIPAHVGKTEKAVDIVPLGAGSVANH